MTKKLVATLLILCLVCSSISTSSYADIADSDPVSTITVDVAEPDSNVEVVSLAAQTTVDDADTAGDADASADVDAAETLAEVSEEGGQESEASDDSSYYIEDSKEASGDVYSDGDSAEDTGDATQADNYNGNSDAETAEEITYTAEDGDVKVTVTAPSGALPEGAKLVVKVYEEDSDEYAEAGEAIELTEEMGMVAMDISFMVDGAEVEPTAPVTVSIDASKVVPDEADLDTLEVQHLEETKKEVEAVLVADSNDAVEGTIDTKTLMAEFEVESFSTFVLSWTNSGSATATITVTVKDTDGNDITTTLEDVTISQGSSQSLTGWTIDGYTFSYAEVIYTTTTETTRNNQTSTSTSNTTYSNATSIQFSGSGYAITTSASTYNVTVGSSSSSSGSGNNKTTTTTTTAISSIVLYYVDVSPAVTISEVDGGSDDSGYTLTATTKNMTGTITYTWSITSGASYASVVAGDDGSATFTWNSSATSGQVVTVSVIATDSEGNTATATYEMTYGKVPIVFTLKYGTSSSSSSVGSGAYVTIRDSEGNVVYEGQTSSDGTVTLYMPYGTYNVVASYKQASSAYYSYSENSVEVSSDAVSILLTQVAYEHIDIKDVLASTDGADTSTLEIEEITKVEVYYNGTLLYTTSSIGTNSDESNWQCLWDTSVTGNSDKHSLAFYTVYDVVIYYTLTDSSTGETTSDSVSINSTTVYPEGTVYPNDGANAYKLYNYLYAETSSSVISSNSYIPDGTVLDISGLSLYIVAMVLCDSASSSATKGTISYASGESSKWGLDFAISVAVLEALSAQITLEFTKVLNNGSMTGSEGFSFALYNATESDGTWTLGTVADTATNGSASADADGNSSVTITFDDVEEQAGTYYYIAVENALDSDDYTYDSTVYGVVVVVTSSADTSATYYKLKAADEEGTYTIDSSETSSASFINIKRVGKISVTKSVTGASAPEDNTAYTVTITAEASSLDDLADVTAVDSNGATVSLTKSTESGKATISFTITKDQTVTLSELPWDTYTVVETDANGAVTTTYTYNNSSNTTGSSVKLDEDDYATTQAVAITNTFPDYGSLAITKLVSDDQNLASADATYNMLITASTVTASDLSAVTAVDGSGNNVAITIGSSGDVGTISLSVSKDQTVTLSNLPIDTYTVVETSTGNFSTSYIVGSGEEVYTEVTAEVEANATTNLTVTNTYPATFVTVTKSWDDSEDAYSTRPESITVNVYNGSTVMDTLTLTAENNWTATSKALPQQLGGVSIVYTVGEATVTGYTSSTAAESYTYYKVGTDSDTVSTASDYDYYIISYAITNTLDTTSVSVEKVWNDEDNAMDTRPTSVAVNIKNGDTVVTTVTLDSSNSWKATLTDLPKYNSDGTQISYTIEEVTTNLSGYAVAYTTDDDGTLVVTNSYPATQVKVTKTWVDPEGTEHDEVTVNIMNGSTVVDTLTLNSENNWTATSKLLAMKDIDGNLITYTVAEVNVTGYTSAISTVAYYNYGDDSEDDEASSTSYDYMAYTITNTIAQEQLSVSGTKVWVDPEGTEHDTVTVQLYRDGAYYTSTTVASDGNWSFTNLDKYDLTDGHEYSYTVKEVAVEGYTSVLTQNEDGTYTITNTIEQAAVSVAVTKVWDDDDNQDGVRPESVTLRLYADGVELTEKTVTLTASNGTVATDAATGNTTWSYTWDELDKYSSTGSIITYTVSEDTVASYSQTITKTYWTYTTDPESGSQVAVVGTESNYDYYTYTVTNTHSSDVASISVTKTWDENAMAYAMQSDVTVVLKANGSQVGDAVTLTADSNYTYTWTDMPVYSNGEKITYTVEETALDGFTTTVSPGSAELTVSESTEFTITNTLEVGSLTVNKTVVAPGTDTSDSTFTIRIYGDGFAALAESNRESSISATVTDSTGQTSRVSSPVTRSDSGYFVEFTISGGDTITLTDIPVGTYTVDETTYTSSYVFNASGEGSYEVTSGSTTSAVITNTITGDKTVTLYKYWDDESDLYGVRPGVDGFSVSLYQLIENEDGSYSLGQDYTASHWTVDDTNTVWYTFQTLPAYDSNGNIITYAVSEPNGAEGYDLTNAVNGSGSTALSTNATLATVTIDGTTYYIITPAKTTELVYTLENTLETGKINVTKTVVDEDGNEVESSDEEPLTFTVILTAYSYDEESGYTAAKDTNGDAISFTTTITAGSTVSFDDLPLGYYWTLTEVSNSSEAKAHSYTMSITSENGSTTRTYVEGEGWFNTYSYINLDSTEAVNVSIVNKEQTTFIDVDMTAFPLAAKILTTDALADDEEMTMTYYFAIRNSDGEIVALGTSTVTATNDADGTGKVTWKYKDEDQFKFSEIGTYTYTIYEVARNTVTSNGEEYNLGGITYDNTVYTLVITVYIDTDPDSDTYGELVADYATYTDYGTDAETQAENDTATFTNTYDPNSTSYTLSVSKALTGRELVAGEFSVTFTEYEDESYETVVESKSVVNDANGAFVTSFGYDARGEYYYMITEDAGSDSGVTYSSETFYVKVVVGTDSTGANLIVSEVYYKTELSGNWTEYTFDAEEDETDVLVFTNVYKASGSAELAAYKYLDGRDLVAGEFAFILTADANTPMPDGAVLATESDAYVSLGYVTAGQYYIVVTNDADGYIDLGSVSYSEANINASYTYTVKEISGDLNGVSYTSRSYNIYVVVEDGGQGELTATVSTSGTRDYNSDGTNDVIFRNTFSQGSVSVSGKKVWVNGGKTYTDANGEEYSNADLITLAVYYTAANGSKVLYASYAGSSENVSWDADGTWTIANLPQYDTEGNEYDWSVDEILDTTKISDSYEKSIVYDEESGLFIITNTIAQDQVSLTGTKTWIEPDEKDHNNSREITLTVRRSSAATEGEETVDSTTYTVTWTGDTYVITGLDKYDSEGYIYVYYVAESLSRDGTRSNQGYTSDIEVETDKDANGNLIYHFVNRAPDDDTYADKDETAITSDGEAVAVVLESSTATTKTYNEVAVGDYITYTITYYNNTNDTATVVITDPLDEGVDYVRSSDGGSYTSSNHTVTWTIEGVEAFTTGTVTLTVKVNSSAKEIEADEDTATVENTAIVTVGNGSAIETVTVINPLEDDDEEAPVKTETYVNETAATASGSSTGDDGYTTTTYDEVAVGDNITYEISYYNNTASRVTVTIDDALDVGVDYVSASDDGSYNSVSHAVSWTVEAEPFSTVTVSLTVSVNETALETEEGEEIATVDNQATVTVGGVSNKTDIASNPLEDDEPEDPVKSITAIGNEEATEGDSVAVGDIVSYEISYYNHYNALTDVVIVDELDEGVDFIAASDNGVYDEDSHTVTWTLESVAPLTEGTVSLQVQVNAEARTANEDGDAQIENGASVTIGIDNAVDTNIVESPLDDDDETEPEKVISADSAGANGESVSIGDELTYVISYYNNNSKAAKVVITDELDAGVDFVSATDGGSYDSKSHTVTWEFDSVAAFTAGTVSVTVVVNENATETASVSNDATVTVGNTSSKTLEVTTDVDDDPRDPEKSVSVGDGSEVNVGDELTYTISYYNNLSSAATVIVVDELDAGVTFESATDGGVYSSADHTVTWTLESVTAYTEGSVSVTVVVNENALVTEGDETASVSNDATVTVGNQSTQTTNEVTNDVPSDDPKDPVKTVDADSDGVYEDDGMTVAVGDRITYQISYYNYNNYIARVVIVDELDEGVTFVSASDGSSYDADTHTVTWTLESVAAFTEGSVWVIVTVNNNAKLITADETTASVVNDATVAIGNDSAVRTNEVENPLEDDDEEAPVKTETYVNETAATASGSSTGDDGYTTTTYDEVAVGDSITYEFSYYNNTASRVTVTIDDALDVGVDYVSASDDGSYNSVSHAVSWTVEAEPFSTVTVSLTVSVNETALETEEGEEIATVDNQATVTVGGVSNKTNIASNPLEDNEPEDPVKSITAIGNEEATEGDSVAVGDIVTYEISYYNHYNALTDVVIVDELDEGVDFIAASDNGVYDEDSHTVTWTLESVAPLTKGTVSLQVQVNAEARTANEDGDAQIENGASVTIGIDNAVDTNIVESPLDDDDETEPEKVISADSAGADGAAVTVGDEITYIITYYNNSSSAAKIAVWDELDAGVEFVSASEEGEYDSDEHAVYWVFEEVPAFTVGTVSVTVKVTDAAMAAGVVANDAAVTINGETKYTTEVTTDVEDEPTDPVKAVDVDGDNDFDDDGQEVSVGDTLTYKVSYYNNLNKEATIKIVDALDATVTYVSGSASNGGVYDADTHSITWEIENVSAYTEGYVTFSVIATTDSATKGIIYNGASVAVVDNSSDGSITYKDTNIVENPVAEVVEETEEPTETTSTSTVVETGDTSSPAMLFVLMLMSFCGLTGLLATGRRRRE